MSNDFVNRVTLDCLLNKDMYSSQIKNKKEQALSKEDKRFYRKRIYNLFKEIINGNPPPDLFLDVKSTYDTFVKTAINYFKAIDRSDIIQSDYDARATVDDLSCNTIDCSLNCSINGRTDYNEGLLSSLRSVKISAPTLDKYVTKISTKKKENIILPQQKDINLQNPEFKSKGIKKNNITNIYEDNHKKGQKQET
jgi:hypothetical protein